MGTVTHLSIAESAVTWPMRAATETRILICVITTHSFKCFYCDVFLYGSKLERVEKSQQILICVWHQPSSALSYRVSVSERERKNVWLVLLSILSPSSVFLYSLLFFVLFLHHTLKKVLDKWKFSTTHFKW